MAKFDKCTFEKTTVVLDGHEFIGCTFKDSKIVVTRGNFSLKTSTFDHCDFEFGGEAANIRNLIMGLINQPQGA